MYVCRGKIQGSIMLTISCIHCHFDFKITSDKSVLLCFVLRSKSLWAVHISGEVIIPGLSCSGREILQD